FPTEPCACTPALSTIVVRGSVVRSGAPLPDVLVQAEAFLTSSCASTRLVFLDDEWISRTNADGNYTLRLLTTFGPATRCLRFIVRPTSITGADSLVIAGIQGTFRDQRPTDTLTLNFTIP
ncbi:MAG: hypothetical protein ACREUZ_22235, partial [Burkholderiales bacterium]